MGKLNKLNKNSMSSNISNEESSVDWSQLISHFENQSVDQAIETIMSKITTTENVEFDQTCLVLKHYLTLDNDKSYLDHFLKFNQSVYFKKLIERFNMNNQASNVTWMLSELIKLITSACDLEQANYMLACEQFRAILCVNIFDRSLLAKFNKNNASNNRSSTVEVTTLTNLFETVSNLCDINNHLIQFVSQTHIEWMCEALVTLDANTDKELIVSIARLLHLFTELAKNNQNGSNALSEILLDLFMNKNFMLDTMTNLTLDPNNNTIVSNNLVAKLYLIAIFVNLILSNKKTTHSDIFSKLLQEYGSLIEYSLNYQLSSKNQEFDLNKATENENEYKIMVKSVEVAIECKMLSIDIIKSILNYFIKSDVTEDDYDEEEIVESENEEDQSQMDTEQDVCMENNDCQKESTTDNLQLNPSHLLTPLLGTILNDDENFLQQTNKIEHIYNSINLIKCEASQACLLCIQYAQTNGSEQSIAIAYLVELLKYILNKPIDETKNDLLGKLAELCFSLFYNVYNKQLVEHETKFNIINLLKDIFFKYKTDECELCIELSRILTMMAIKERNTNVVDGQFVIDMSAKILLELITASFELNDQATIQSLKLNAELLDLLIDLFSEDNLKELETSLNFINKIKYFSEKFYAKYKTLASKKKLKKDDGLIVKTVRDNLKSFVDYKIQKSK